MQFRLSSSDLWEEGVQELIIDSQKPVDQLVSIWYKDEVIALCYLKGFGQKRLPIDSAIKIEELVLKDEG